MQILASFPDPSVVAHQTIAGWDRRGLKKPECCACREESSLVRQASDLSTNPYPKDEAVEFVASLKERPTQAPPSNKKKKSSFKSLFGLMSMCNPPSSWLLFWRLSCIWGREGI